MNKNYRCFWVLLLLLLPRGGAKCGVRVLLKRNGTERRNGRISCCNSVTKRSCGNNNNNIDIDNDNDNKKK